MNGFVMTPVYDLLLRGDDQVPVGLYHLHLVTAEQLCRLHYSPGSLTTVKARLKTLVDNGYIQYDRIPSKNPRSPYYYTLAAGGLRYLKKQGQDILPSARGSKEQDKQYTHITHTLELNNVIIAAATLGLYSDIYRLNSFIHERELKRPEYKYDVVPDALLDFRMLLENGKQRRMAVLLEHDRAYEHINAFKPRIRAYVKMLKAEAYRKLFNVGAVRIAFVTLKGERHAEKMRQWTKEQLTATGDMETGGLSFYFKNLIQPMEPVALWLGSDWKTVYADEPVSLLAG